MYNELYKAWKSEKDAKDTQPLPGDFYQRAETYLRGLGDEMEPVDEHSAKARLMVKEREMATRLLTELKETRLRKLLSLAQNSAAINQGNLTEEENALVKGLESSLQAFQKHGLQQESKSSEAHQTVELSVVRFLKDVPEIVGTDLRLYGPYKKEDVGSLPVQNASALAKQGLAKEIEVRASSAQSENRANPAINNK